ncbi:MAG: glycoside hydrolase family 15 protein [Myxococcales bacterium]|nr:glycoside hydrolase family 15 protein [Myxococcales bacterium]
MTPIDHHALLSDNRGLALVEPSGAVVWLCAPRPDDPPLFGRLLDPGAGAFELAPATGVWASQAYDGDTLVLRSEGRALTLTDYLDLECRSGCRLVRCVEGRGRVRVSFAPRLDLGARATSLVPAEGGWRVAGTDVVLRCEPPIPLELRQDGLHQTLVAEVEVDGRLLLELAVDADLPVAPEPARRAATAAAWRSWLDTLTLPPGPRALFARSALTLKALVHAPTGAILAAATCSLPEVLGGVRNWDYRFCWPRDASYAAATLARLGDPSVGLGLLEWLKRCAGDLERADMLEPLYTVAGERLEGEVLREELDGYAGSRPVRVGNGAAGQTQLDAFGPVIDLCAVLEEAGARLDAGHLALLEQLCDAITRSWDREGHGVWELRARARSHVYSRGMCWLALTRGAQVLARAGRDVARYEAEAARIQAQVAARGFHPEAQAFTMAYGEPELDAAVLKLIGSGFFTEVAQERATVMAIERALGRGPVIDRYRMDDGLPGAEGGFILCAFWLVEALWRVGERDAARARFEALRGIAGPLGLYCEEYDPEAGLGLGNFPQAYSQLGLLDAARVLGG